MLNYIFKISDKDDNLLVQIVNPQGIEITQVLNNFDSAVFFLPFNSQFATKAIIKQFNRVDIYEQIDSVETKVFEGVIRGYEPNLEGVVINVSNFLYLFAKRTLFSAGYTASAEPVNTTLQNILNTLNGIDDTGITLDTTDILTTAVNKEYERGDDFGKILQDLAVAVNGEFAIKDRGLQFKQTIGIDRTVVGASDYRQFRFDIVNPSSNTINNAESVVDTIDFANGVLGKSGVNYSEKTDSTSIATYGRIDLTKSFSESDATGLPDQTQNTLDLSKNLQEFPRITPSTKGMFFQSVDTGDLVSIFINTGSNLFSFNGNFKIVKKTLIRTDLAVPRIELEFSENAVSDKDLTDLLNDLKNRVSTIELNL